MTESQRYLEIASTTWTLWDAFEDTVFYWEMLSDDNHEYWAEFDGSVDHAAFESVIDDMCEVQANYERAFLHLAKLMTPIIPSTLSVTV